MSSVPRRALPNAALAVGAVLCRVHAWQKQVQLSYTQSWAEVHVLSPVCSVRHALSTEDACILQQ